LLDAGKIWSTATETPGKIDAAVLKRAHGILETNKGKLIREGFSLDQAAQISPCSLYLILQ
jgi:hypothetical protein